MDTVKDFQTSPEFDDMDSDGMMYLREKQINLQIIDENNISEMMRRLETRG